jgi:heme A synthase
MTTSLATAEASEAVRPEAPGRQFGRLAWLASGYTLFVILFGAVVRITGSGAGCGQHWPTCHGEIAHLPRTIETAIELTHRVTSGLSLLLVLWVVIAARRTFPKRHRVRKAAFWAFAFIIVEALIGAGLVLLELVGTNKSVARAIVMPLHLVSTSILMAALTLAAWWSRPRTAAMAANPGRFKALLVTAAAGVLLVSGTGAITALGDTLYPVQSAGVGGGLADALGMGAHFLQRLRLVHPILAVCVTVFIFYASAHIAENAEHRTASKFARLLMFAVGAQIAIGVLNVLLSAPGVMQVVHLAAANVVWVLLVLLAATLFERTPNVGSSV